MCFKSNGCFGFILQINICKDVDKYLQDVDRNMSNIEALIVTATLK